MVLTGVVPSVSAYQKEAAFADLAKSEEYRDAVTKAGVVLRCSCCLEFA